MKSPMVRLSSQRIEIEATVKLEWRRIVDLDCLGVGMPRIEEDATFLLNHHRGYRQRRRLQAFLLGRTDCLHARRRRKALPICGEFLLVEYQNQFIRNLNFVHHVLNAPVGVRRMD